MLLLSDIFKVFLDFYVTIDAHHTSMATCVCVRHLQYLYHIDVSRAKTALTITLLIKLLHKTLSL